MVTLTEKITQQLLDAADDPAGLEAVFQQHGHSKGPLYSALAQATATLKDRFPDLAQKCKGAETECQEYRQQGKEAKEGLTSLEEARAAKAKELAELEEKAEEKKELLKRARALTEMGFGSDELSRLHGLLAQVAATTGNKSREAVALFFSEIDRYQSIMSLELETKGAEVATAKAKAEAETSRAEAKAAEARAKARRSSIDLADKLLARGIKEDDLPRWTLILSKGGIAPEQLAQALERLASVECLVQSRQKRADELEGQIAKLGSQVKALTREREGMQAAIQAVREGALVEVRKAREGVVASLKDLDDKVREVGGLREQLGSLRAEVTLAHALRDPDPNAWRAVSPDSIIALLGGVLAWARARDFNPKLPPPEQVRQPSLGPWITVPFSGLLQWAGSGLMTAASKALAEHSAQ